MTTKKAAKLLPGDVATFLGLNHTVKSVEVVGANVRVRFEGDGDGFVEWPKTKLVEVK